MKARLLFAWDIARSTYWFVPLLLVAATVAIALLILGIDPGRPESADAVDPTAFGSADSARQFLSAAAGSSITVAGLVFSIAIVAMSLAASQYGPRLIRNFVQDLGNQLALGTFLASFTFFVLILGAVRGDGPSAVVPILAVRLAFAVTLVDVVVLILFIHHAASQIQVANIIAAAGHDLDHTIAELYPTGVGYEPANDAEAAGSMPADLDTQGMRVVAGRVGYVDAIDGGGLLADAVRHDLIVDLRVRPGSFVEPGTVVAVIWPVERVTDRTARTIERRLLLGRQRTEFQDVEFAIQQIVQIAVRALSPAINDPFTAYACLDRLGVALGALARRSWPSRYRVDAAGRLRIIADAPTFDVLLSQAVSEIRHAGRGNLTVTVRLLETLEAVAGEATRPADQDAIRRQAERVAEHSKAALAEPWERKVIEDRLQRCLAAAQGAKVSAG
jgi:uncharacterized membrane protein